MPSSATRQSCDLSIAVGCLGAGARFLLQDGLVPRGAWPGAVLLRGSGTAWLLVDAAHILGVGLFWRMPLVWQRRRAVTSSMFWGSGDSIRSPSRGMVA
jgi:hypothetical protein